MKSHIPDAMLGNYPLSVEVIADTIKQFEEKEKIQKQKIQELEQQYEEMEIEEQDWDEVCKIIPSWIEVFNDADKKTKRVLINKLVDKVIVKKDEITVKFKINLSKPRHRQSRMSGYNWVSKQRIRFYKYFIYSI